MKLFTFCSSLLPVLFWLLSTSPDLSLSSYPSYLLFVFNYLFLAICSLLSIWFLASRLRPLSAFFVTQLLTCLPRLPFLKTTNVILLYSLVQSVDLFFFLSSGSIHGFNNSLSALPVGFKFIQLSLFFLAITYASTHPSSAYHFFFFFIGIASLFSLKRNLLLICLLSYVFRTASLDFSSLSRIFLRFRLRKSSIRWSFIYLALPFSFLLVFGYLGILRSTADATTDLSPDLVLRYAYRILQHYVSMPFYNLFHATNSGHSFSCPLLPFVDLIPNRFTVSVSDLCGFTFFLPGIYVGYFGSLILAPTYSIVIANIIVAVTVSVFFDPRISRYLAPVSFYYFLTLFQYNLFLNLPFVLSPLVAALIFSKTRKPSSTPT